MFKYIENNKYGILSLVIPIIVFLLGYLVIHFPNAEFWNNLNPKDDADQNAAVLLIFSEGIQYSFIILFGSFLGLIAFYIGLAFEPFPKGLLTVGLLFNSIPFLILFYLLFKLFFNL